jgi:hypothetical protein
LAQQQWDEAHPGISPEALAALEQQNQQAYSTMLDVQNALDAYDQQANSPSTSTAPDTTVDTTVDTSPAPDFSSVNYDTSGGGSDNGAEVRPVPVTLPVFGETTPTTTTETIPSASTNPYYGISDSQGKNTPSSGISSYISSNMPQRNIEVPLTDFSKFSFPTQPVTVTAPSTQAPAASSVQDIYPLFDTGTTP